MEVLAYVAKPKENVAEAVNVELEFVDIAFQVEKIALIQMSYENYLLLDQGLLGYIPRQV